MNKPPKELPKLPYGQGSFSWANKEHTNIKFQRLYDLPDSPSKKVRLIVYGRSVNECFSKMADKEKSVRLPSKGIQGDKAILSNMMLRWLFVAKSKKNKANSIDRDECTIKNQIESYDIGNMAVDEIEPKDIKDHIHYLQYEHNNGKGYSFSTVKKTFEILDQFFAYYYRKNQNGNPMNGIDRPTRRKEIGEITLEDADSPEEIKDLVLSDDEIKLFKAACYQPPAIGKCGGTKYGVALYFIMVTFLRVGEATTLTWGDVDYDRKILKVTKAVSRVKDRNEKAKKKTKIILTKPKTKKSIREVVLTDEALEALDYIKANSKHTEQTDYILSTDKGTRVLEQNLLSGLKGKLKSCGLNPDGRRDKFGIHYLRHTGISYYLRHGISVDIISQMAGHASTAITTQTYYHVIKSQKEEALRMMNTIS